MLSWTYGRSKKSTYEAERKLSITELDDLVSGSHIPGICFFFTDLACGIPPIIRRYIQHTHSIREIVVVVTIRTLPVAADQRLNVGKLGSEGVYRCLIQFGYKDANNINGNEYVDLIVAKLLELTDNEAEKQKIERRGIAFVTGRTILKANKESGNEGFQNLGKNYIKHLGAQKKIGGLGESLVLFAK